MSSITRQKKKGKRLKTTQLELIRCKICGCMTDAFDFPFHITLQHPKEYREYMVQVGLWHE